MFNPQACLHDIRPRNFEYQGWKKVQDEIFKKYKENESIPPELDWNNQNSRYYLITVINEAREKILELEGYKSTHIGWYIKLENEHTETKLELDRYKKLYEELREEHREKDWQTPKTRKNKNTESKIIELQEEIQELNGQLEVLHQQAEDYKIKYKEGHDKTKRLNAEILRLKSQNEELKTQLEETTAIAATSNKKATKDKSTFTNNNHKSNQKTKSMPRVLKKLAKVVIFKGLYLPYKAFSDWVNWVKLP